MSLSGPESNESKVDVTEVDKITKEIKNLVETPDPNAESQKDLNRKLTKEVVDQLTSSGDDVKNQLKESILKLFEGHENDQNFLDGNEWFVKLAEALWLKKNEDWSWSENDDASKWSEEVADNIKKLELPEFPLQWTLDWIDEWEDGKKQSKLYSKLVRNRPEEWQEDTSEQWLRLYETTAKISDQLSQIDEFLWNDKLKDNKDITWMKDLLENIQRVIDNTTENNVKLLQQYIYENLEGQDQIDFKHLSYKKSGGFDWMFWVGTLTWLNKVLENTWEYIKLVADSLSQMEDLEVKQKLDSVVAKSSVNYVQWSWDPDLKLWLSEFPDWASVDFLNDDEKAKINESWEQKIKLKVEINWQEKIIEVTVNVGNSNTAETNPEKQQPVVDPLVLGDKQYFPVKTVPVSGSEISWATFYSTEVYSPGEASTDGWSDDQMSEMQPNFAENIKEVDWDRLYYMKKGNNIYEVKIDSWWNLCPVARNVNSDKPVVFENNKSCMKYLLNKLPTRLQNEDLYFTWNGKDYVMWLWGYKKRITIEPMTIAWFWLKWNGWERWATLTESLAFLNLTNYLRNVWEYRDVEFKNNNPNLKLIWNELYVRVNGNKNVGLDENWKEVKHWRRLKIQREEFGLTNDNEVLQRFIRYNNHEDWNDDWDRKTPNKYYKSVKL